MLSIMRKHAKSWLIKVALGIISIVFIFYFGVSRYQQRAVKMATVNGEMITLDEYQQVYRELLRQVQNQYRDMLNDDLLSSLNLKQRALDSVIEERLLIQEAERLHFTVTPEELRENIRSLPYFLVNGHFDQTRYLQILRANRLEPADFEKLQARQLMINKARDYITSNLVVGEKEALERFMFEREKVQIDYLVFKPEAHLDQVKIDDQELDKYFQENIKRYQVPAKIKIAYLLFQPENLMDKIVITPEEIQDEYNENLETYKQPEQVHARHILFKVDEDDPKKVEEVKKKAEDVLKQAKSGTDFAELAKKYSEGPTGKKGGDLGFFARGSMVKPFEDAAFALKPGEISGLVRTRFGFHIIKVEAVKQARTKTLDEVKESIEKELKEIQAKDMTAEAAEQTYEQIMQGTSLKSLGDQQGAHYVETGFLSVGQNITGLENEGKVAQTAFSLEKEEVSPVLDTAKGYVILQVIDKQEPRDPVLEEVKEKVIKDLKLKKAREKAKEEAQQFLSVLKNWKDFPKEAQNKKYKVEETKPFKRGESISGIGFAPIFYDSAFSLTQESPFCREPLFHKGAYYLIRLKKRVPATKEEFEKEKVEYMDKLLVQKKNMAFSNWLKYIKNKASIELHQQI